MIRDQENGESNVTTAPNATARRKRLLPSSSHRAPSPPSLRSRVEATASDQAGEVFPITHLRENRRQFNDDRLQQVTGMWGQVDFPTVDPLSC